MSRIGSQDRLRRFLHEVVVLLVRTRAGLDRHAMLFRDIRQMIVAGRQDLERGQRATLDIGSWLVLGTLGLGLQVGHWPLWTVLLALAGYAVWVVVYSEATVQATRRQRGEPGLRLVVSD
jgi:hypothetical protein